MSRSLLFLAIIALLILGYVSCTTNIDVSVSVNAGGHNHNKHHEEMAPNMEESDSEEGEEEEEDKDSNELVGSGYGSCKFNGKTGTCMAYNQCKGVSTTLNLCPGGNNVRCCVPKTAAPTPKSYGSCNWEGEKGTCIDYNQCKGVTTTANLCPGDNNVRCCVAKKPSPAPAPTPSGKYCYNKQSLDMLESAEGFVAHYYVDQTGHGTIGYGSACFSHNGCRGIPNPVSRQQAEDILLSDVKSNYGACVRNAIHADKMTSNQYGALTSFTYNEGCGVISHVAGYMNEGNHAAVFSTLREYTSGGLLTSRREKEIALFNTKDDSACVQSY